MSKNVILAAALATLGLLNGPASAADSDKNYSVWGPGNVTCEAYGKMVADQDKDFHNSEFWIGGYLTAFNRMSPETWDIVGGGNANISTVALWLTSYCKDHPKTVLATAMLAYTEAMQPKRIVLGSKK
jgi:hypothetical protein